MTAKNKEIDELETQDLESEDRESEETGSADEKLESTFRDLDLSEDICRALEDAGYRNPTKIQAATIPPMLQGRDVLGQAQIGRAHV